MDRSTKKETCMFIAKTETRRITIRGISDSCASGIMMSYTVEQADRL